MKKILFICALLPLIQAGAAMKLEGTFNWQSKSVETLRPGVVYVSMELKQPRLMKLSAVRVDLSTPGIRFKMTPRDKEWGKPMKDLPKFTIRTRRMTCRKFMEEAVKKGENMCIVINGSPWAPWQAPWNHTYADRQGLIVADGVMVSPVMKNRPTFAVYKDGSCGFVQLEEKADISSIRHAISGFAFVLKKGSLTGRDNPKALAPRTGYGLSADGKFLYLLVIDGRQKEYSMGSSVYEVGELLKFFGADTGLNMDGGGSTTLFLRKDKEKKLIKLNHHRNNSERTVGGAMGIIFAAPR